MSLESALEKITAQQCALEEQAEAGVKGVKGTSLGPRPNDRAGSARAAWMVGEQLKDMLRSEPGLAELIEQDLEVPEMSLAECEKKIKAYADGHKTGNFACVTPAEAEEIIREFYGLPERGQAPEQRRLIRLEDFF